MHLRSCRHVSAWSCRWLEAASGLRALQTTVQLGIADSSMGAGRGAEEEAAMQDPTIGPNSRLAEFRNKVLKGKTDRRDCDTVSAWQRCRGRTQGQVPASLTLA